ncbi:hypothetical protein [Fusobacterium necrophorum]|uniref:hypothetical protein n=1 Tax=Fusobacterium necrophorum TaxID=859 RepID=UPI00370EAF9B
MKVNQYYTDVPIEREFYCRHCGTYVKIVDPKDKRTVYCSQKCEKQYWRDKTKAEARYKKRSREKVLGLRNYSKRQILKKLWQEKKEAEETENIGRIYEKKDKNSINS